MFSKLRYRLALDLGSNSLGWAMVRLNGEDRPQPIAVIRAGVRIFPDGRNPKDGSSLAVTRREARAMRRRRDRLLKRKACILRGLEMHGFFPKDKLERKALETLNPYELRARGLDHALTPAEFGRALFHINQRRGFLSNRKTDKKDNESGAMKTAIKRVQTTLAEHRCRTVGEWLWQRMQRGEKVKARFREARIIKEDGKAKVEKSYDLYIDRAMIANEFETLWVAQKHFHPEQYSDTAYEELKHALLFQRPLKPVKPGRCTLLPEEERAPLALPSVQRFRIYQELNNLRILGAELTERALTLEQRNLLASALERKHKVSFTQIKKLIGLNGTDRFNIEDPKRQDLKGNGTSTNLAMDDRFGERWHQFSDKEQDEIAWQILNEENESVLIRWLVEHTGVDELRAEKIANTGLAEGYGNLSRATIDRILPHLRESVVTYDKAVVAAGFEHHSDVATSADGEVWPSLPYYGEALQRHVGFGSNDPNDPEEKRFGKIANPTVHIGLNQLRLVVNSLIKKYGHPTEVVIELARDLKQSKAQRDEENRRQAERQRKNQRWREEVARVRGISEDRVKSFELQKMQLWEELAFDPLERKCPYSGVQISVEMLLSDEVEIEHILPFSQTLDDSLNNKTVALRRANAAKGNRTPFEAFGKDAQPGYAYADILERAEKMVREKRYRFGPDAMGKWDKEGNGFLARALNDTRYLSRIAREYMTLVCSKTRVIPGQMTAKLRERMGLNDILGLHGEKNRNDHRHHAVDACVIAITDQRMLQQFANASASAREKNLTRLVESIEPPWSTYRDQVARAIQHIWVSHKPDHSHEGAMHNDTAYALLGNGVVSVHKMVDGKRTKVEENLKVIEIASSKALERHGLRDDGTPKPYKGYKGDSNYCIEIFANEKGKWTSEVISTYQAYQIVKQGKTYAEGIKLLRNPHCTVNGKALVMRLVANDLVRLEVDGAIKTMRVATIKSSGQVLFAPHNEANVDARNRDKEDAFSYTSKMAGSLQAAKARRVTVSPIGEMNDPGFKG